MGTISSEQRIKLVNALTEYDIKQSKKKFYNVHALPLYFRALQKCVNFANKGHELRLCLLNCFNGQLLDKLLKKMDLPLHTKEEAFVGGFERIYEDE
jgi:hypothetical protein